jgi:hypothetical protein
MKRKSRERRLARWLTRSLWYPEARIR